MDNLKNFVVNKGLEVADSINTGFITLNGKSVASLVDSSNVLGLIDSSYVQARAPAAGNDSATTIALIDSSYVQARAPAAGNDSATTIALIDSDYVQARAPAAGNDSATTIALIDSDYVQARQTTPVPAFTKVSIAGQGDVVADADAAVALFANLTQQQKLTASDAGSNDFFGISVDIKGDYAVVGARGEQAAYVYTRSGTTWSQQAKLTGSSSTSNFGIYVQMSTDTNYIIVGSPFYGTGGGGFVFVRSGSSWSQQAILVDSGVSSNDEWQRVAISSDGTYAVVASIRPNSYKGRATVFVRSGTSWTQQEQFDGVAASDNFGVAVGISDDGTTLAVGAHMEGADDKGAVYVSTRSGTTWSSMTKLVASDGDASDRLSGGTKGVDINEDGTLIVAGAYGHDTGSVGNAGAAYIFKYSGSSWSQAAKITPPSNTLNYGFGWTVAISRNDVAIGYHTTKSNLSTADAHVYTTTDESTWTLAKTYTGSDIAAGMDFSHGLAIDNAGTIVVGASGTTNTSTSPGAAYIFTAPLGVMLEDTLTLEAGSGITLTTAAGTDTVTIAGSAAGIDSAATTALVDSAYVQARQTTPVPAFTKVSIAGQGDVVADADAAEPLYANLSQQAKLVASDAGTNDFFGISVDIKGDYAVIGARAERAAYVFTRSGTTWTQQAKLTGSSSTSNFGLYVAMSTDTNYIIVGSPNYSTGGGGFVFVRSGSSWSQQAILVDSNVGSGHEWERVAISSDGTYAVIGSIYHNSFRGRATVFIRSGTTWTQQAQFTGVAANDSLASAVSISDNGATLALGASMDDDADGNAGTVHVHTRSGTTWSSRTTLTASDAGGADYLGGGTKGVDINEDGTLILAGAYGHDIGGVGNSGAVYLFKYSGGSWSQVAKITPPSNVLNQGFGHQVAISGNTVAVGYHDTAANLSSAVAHVYTTTDESTWTLAKTYTASDIAAGMSFGHGLAIDNAGTIVVGASGTANTSTSSGAAYVFTAPMGVMLEDTLTLEAGTGITLTTAAGTDTVTIAGSAGGNDSATTIALIDSAYVQARQTSGGGGNDSATTIALVDSDYVQARQITPISAFNTVTVASVDVVADTTGVHWPTTGQNQKVTASDAANNDFFGNVVDIDGDYAVVGARGNKAAYILYYNGSAWTEQQKIQETTFGSNFGASVSISGDTVVIGSNNEDVNSADGTKAYVYTRSGTTWSLQQKVDPSQAHQGDYFGYQRIMKLDKSNSDQFIAGAYGEDQSYSDEGAVYIFTRSGTTWSEQQRIIPSGSAINANYGVTVDIAGDYAVFGGRPGNNFAVYVWTRSGTTWSQQAALTQPSGHTNTQYAYHSGLSINSAGDTIAVGAYGNTSTQAGKVFIFTRSGTTWTNQAVIQPSDTANGDFFGWECRLDTTGNILTVGAKLASTGGKVYIFTRSGTTWTEATGITASDVASNWEFGEDVGIDGTNNKIIVGARGYNSSANGQGAAYVFNAGATAKYSDTLTLEAGSNITLTTNASTDTVTIAGSAVDELISIDSNLTSIDSDQVIHSFSKTSFRTMKYVAQLKHAGDNTYHSQEILLTHNGTFVTMTGYAKLFLDSDLGEFDAAINGDNVELRLTPTKTNINVKLKAISTGV